MSFYMHETSWNHWHVATHQVDCDEITGSDAMTCALVKTDSTGQGAGSGCHGESSALRGGMPVRHMGWRWVSPPKDSSQTGILGRDRFYMFSWLKEASVTWHWVEPAFDAIVCMRHGHIKYHLNTSKFRTFVHRTKEIAVPHQIHSHQIYH